MKRVLFISHYAGTGGANLSMLYLILNLKSFGVEALVFIPKHGPIEEAFIKNGIKYEIHHYASLRIADRGFLVNAFSTILRVAINTFQAVRLGFRLRKEIDIIHSNSSLVFFGAFLKLIIRKPLVWHLREFGKVDYNLVFGLGRKLSAYCYAKADRVIAISGAMNSFFKENVYEGNNLITLYNGVDESTIVCKFNLAHLSSDGKVKIAIVGGISEAKNQEDLILAVGLMDKLNYHVDIIGGGEEKYMIRLKQLVSENNLGDTVSFLGNKTNIGELLSDYDIGVITSKNEAFGRVTIEYMLAGLAVIGSRAGANPEIILDGENGLLYELGNHEDLAEKIASLVTDEAQRSRLAKNAYETAMQNYTARINAKRVNDIYAKLV